jgi:uncharacterized protein YfeS
MKPEDLLKLSKKKLVDKLQALNFEYDEKFTEMVMIREELLARLKEEKKDGELVGEFSIARATRITFKTTLEQAKELGAVVEVPKVNTKALRKLHDSKVKVPGVDIKVYLSVRRISQSEGEK